MSRLALLISPRARAAYFAEEIVVARAELSLAGFAESERQVFGGMQFLTITAERDAAARLARLSFVQGIFEITDTGFHPLEADAGFLLHEDFVWGEKYRGKTNETLTQLLVNIGLAVVGPRENPRLLDPMCGRGTTLLWGMRYGLNACGIEQDPAALGDVRRGLKKWTKLHRQKHKLTEGFVQKSNRKGLGKYLEFQTEGKTARIITGPTESARDLLQRRRFDIIATDLPYGVQHMGGPSTRSPIEVIKAAAQGWAESLNSGGVMVLAFNNYMPKRADLLAAFEDCGLDEVPLDIAHRMSESILRDVLVLQKSEAG